MRLGLLALAVTLSVGGRLWGVPIQPRVPCTQTTLDQYLNSSGCSVGEIGFSFFLFKVESSSRVVPITPPDILVSPLAASGIAGLIFSSPGFAAADNEAATYRIKYHIDPDPIIFSFHLLLGADSPVAGSARVDTRLCVGGIFLPPNPEFGEACLGGGSYPLSVFHSGDDQTAKLVDAASFPLTNHIDIINFIQVSASNGGNASIAGVGNAVSYITEAVPEPTTLQLAGVAMFIMVLAFARRVSI
jgi:hypothetical protein